MKSVLIVGGTNFVGRVFLEDLIERGEYAITMFNRGKTNPGVFGDVQHIKGDRRTDDILQLEGTSWDYIVDFSSYDPDHLKRFLAVVGASCGRYIYISTCSVYDMEGEHDLLTEDFKLFECADEHRNSTSMEYYGPKKAACEAELMAFEGLDYVIFRPSLIYGKYDPFDRTYYWLKRIKEAHSFILPEDGRHLCSLTYINDMSRYLQAAMKAERHNKIYNISTQPAYSFKTFCEKVSSVFNVPLDYKAVGMDQLKELDLMPGRDFPMWFAVDLNISFERLKTDFGDLSVSFEQSIEENAVYYESLGWPDPKPGISIEKEMEILAKL